MEDRYRIDDATEEWVDAVFAAKFDPNLPMGILGLGSFRANSVGDVVLDSAEVSVKANAEFRRQGRHDRVCGYVVLRREMS